MVSGRPVWGHGGKGLREGEAVMYVGGGEDWWWVFERSSCGMHVGMDSFVSIWFVILKTVLFRFRLNFL